MRFIPTEQDACALLSAMQQAMTVEGERDEREDDTTMAAVESYLQRRQDNPTASPRDATEELAQGFRTWWQAAQDADEYSAKAAQSRIEHLARQSPFPWSKVQERYRSLLVGITYEYRPWSELSDGVITATIPDTATVAIIGDWGTGDPDAKALLTHLKAHNPHVILHLGDIYPSGTWSECQRCFLEPYEEVFPMGGPRPPMLTIPGNHEYYSGGGGYYRLIDTLNRDSVPPGWIQGHSFYCLRTAGGAWQFLGGDTGYASVAYGQRVEPRLRSRELAWHADKLDHFGGRTVFMTHHQFVSADSVLNGDAIGDLRYFNKRLVEQMKDRLPQIDLWLWGHDHYFLAYRPDLPLATGHALRLGQLLGGSAREVTRQGIAWAAALQHRGGVPIVPDTSANRAPDGTRLVNHTYAIMRLDPGPGKTSISYYQAHAWYDETDRDPGKPVNPLHAETL